MMIVIQVVLMIVIQIFGWVALFMISSFVIALLVELFWGH